MPIATGIAKQLRFKKESTWGTAAGASGAQLLRRVTSDLNLTKETYQSNEIRSDYQIADYRHGVRSVTGSINGELSPGTYSAFMQSALRRDFAAVTALTGLSITIAGTGPYTITRAAGDFLSGGIKIGMVVRLTAGTFTAGNLNNNILVTGVTATVITGITLNGTSLTAEGPIASATLTIPGKATYTPTTGHTDDSYSIEHWHNDITQSELFTGCKIGSMEVSLPPSGMSTVTTSVMGKDVTTSASAAYFTSPTAETSAGVLAAVNGVAFALGSRQYAMTGLSISINGGMSAEPVIGSNTYADIFEGRVNVTGNFTAFFENGTFRDAFLQETEVAMFFVFTASNSNNADFIAFAIPRAKLGSSSKDDGEKGIVQTHDFQALFNSVGGTGTSTEKTTLWVQDSLA
jgi:hypothetical protein